MLIKQEIDLIMMQSEKSQNKWVLSSVNYVDFYIFHGNPFNNYGDTLVLAKAVNQAKEHHRFLAKKGGIWVTLSSHNPNHVPPQVGT